MLHLLEHVKQFDRYMVTAALTRKGILNHAHFIYQMFRGNESCIRAFRRTYKGVIGGKDDKDVAIIAFRVDIAEEIQAKAKQMESYP